jgi:hypothetical protein
MHINHQRGETRRFVWRREHYGITHRTWVKGKSASHKDYKQTWQRQYRARERQAMRQVDIYGWENAVMPIAGRKLLWLE